MKGMFIRAIPALKGNIFCISNVIPIAFGSALVNGMLSNVTCCLKKTSASAFLMVLETIKVVLNIVGDGNEEALLVKLS